ncbi:ABC transporter substrate-binding protein [Candidatus Poriferisodalis sp.]|uniref:ABC transporter substrate-binding protein n=1 Tax=Candidatus Poriferisodalis sp. TaxID=3101277 RepID=UPI003B028100
MNRRPTHRRLAAVAFVVVLAAAACGGDSESSIEETQAPAATTQAAAQTTEGAAGDTMSDHTPMDQAGDFCGLGTGEPATGEPIVIGNVTTSIPGIDFSSGPLMMQAYFECVNANGGIHGRPLEMVWENDNGIPDDAAAAARKLIETDQLVAIGGGFSILDCAVNAAYYEEQGYNVVLAGVPAECFSSPNIAATNMGPAYSLLGAAQAVIAKGPVNKVVTSTGVSPAAEYGNSLAGIFIEQSGLEWEDVQYELPIADATTVALDLVNRAGDGGGVLLNYTPPEGLKILKAAEEQGLIDRVIWGSSTPLNDSSVAVALGEAWKGKVNVNAEFSLLDDPRPDIELYRQVTADYNPDPTLGSFQQMGFVAGRIIVHALLGMDPADLDDPVAVNAAIGAVKNFQSDHLCKPWYFGGLPLGNVPNNWDYNVVPDGVDRMVDDSGCFEIAAIEPILVAVREAEAAGGLTSEEPNNWTGGLRKIN